MFRFTIRDMLWLMVVVAMGVGWWIDRTRLVRQPQPLPPKDETYELIQGGKDGDKMFLFNPRTGHVWQRQSSGKWKDYAKSPNPVAKPQISN